MEGAQEGQRTVRDEGAVSYCRRHSTILLRRRGGLTDKHMDVVAEVGGKLERSPLRAEHALRRDCPPIVGLAAQWRSGHTLCLTE